ncbi:hypothetical protein [Sphingomonas abaci]|uniref:Uncharacterized protein n=1 Tax=Sphingomonas abaci TaxID=237611 RepID=A0A7W7EYP9_9SPHN|nr:hypothetical protein [Sphingomonas abaci]MBB4618902.1 hypothetical protein [Sphingomonas abaci]
MTKSLPFALLAAGSLLSATAAIAAPQMAGQPSATKATTATHMVKTTRTTTTRRGAAPRMVTTKTSTGKTVTYDCSKAGNATKAACKK